MSIRKVLVPCVAVFGLAVATAPASADSVLWYNGDFDGVNGLLNMDNGVVPSSHVYDDFVVTDSGGWLLSSIFSNNLTDVGGATTANWEIRSGVSAGNGGTVIYSGTSAVASTATGRSGFGFNEFHFEVSGLSLLLSQGTYWLMVAPVGAGSGSSYVSTASGLNSVGTPAGNNDNSFFDSATFGANFSPASTQGIGPPADFSLGVVGVVNPEPGTIALFGAGTLGLLGWAVRRRRAAAKR